MSELEKVLQIALAEVGYLEKKTNSQLDSKTANAGYNNYTKYARDLDAITGFYNGKKNGYAWCDMFVDWCFIKTFGLERAKELLCYGGQLGAGCEFSAKYFKNKNQYFKTPKLGDQIFFKNTSGKLYHTGLVYAIDDNYVYTIEGNTSSASGVVENGGAVEKKKYKLNYSKIGGYGRPKYKEVEKMEFNSGLQALDFLYMHDRITDKEYWLKVLDTTKNVEYLLIKWAEDFSKLLLTN